ncbi:MAG: hypothetical protein A3C93_03985 [Candidatus Lloydbacteria bacterium RIFCSPHIGHO2_02_FULL_54_17]|uniref:Uncharacterized protein n=1 Tax=Candidatus Lloydbacteria bacterium RIFCSPHIGHO2_02_FULL_54_17 TaxID=1798664 RepID=A0A1G2DH31_9BACT|nr:MAG: hypothetical protein A2762_03430 [Candidatus Lloydbacteria bacterium RIFCSPHIGHO2_01_FULL_54_11]OGZ12271.1 MAG: hypothetical protein A3C93_03985 [Candidatus Lloydbacteria bacterium RIFCSPHIGHO2_02_FULL_54_17]OGZ13974.1 MAG: hypothetical protein A2948_00635 [Candidatus Lloydbacteria bacterium RIFCSPLOWO2_01_FULL_54_18]OGZ16420.1 MAG: hypothetical protein A3H76_05345 [Candidatus Lloydbacteria bacterium RIFCSPLOWO2_02_FULL_54_12]
MIKGAHKWLISVLSIGGVLLVGAVMVMAQRADLRSYFQIINTEKSSTTTPDVATNTEEENYFDYLEKNLLPTDEIILINEGTSTSPNFITLHLESIGKTISFEHASWMEPAGFYRLEILDLSETTAFNVKELATGWWNISQSEELFIQTEERIHSLIRDTEEWKRRVITSRQYYQDLIDRGASAESSVDVEAAKKLNRSYQLSVWISGDQLKLIDALIAIRQRTLWAMNEGEFIDVMRADRDSAASWKVALWYDKGIDVVDSERFKLEKQIGEINDKKIKGLMNDISGLTSNLNKLQAEVESDTKSCQSLYGTNVEGYQQQCYCADGYEFNKAKSACVKISISDATKPENLSHDGFCINSIPYSKWRISLRTAVPACECEFGYTWNTDHSACVK